MQGANGRAGGGGGGGGGALDGGSPDPMGRYGGRPELSTPPLPGPVRRSAAACLRRSARL
jgi:hypothetical protein